MTATRAAPDAAVLRQQCLDSLAVFCLYFQGPGWFDPTHKILCDWLQAQYEPALQALAAGQEDSIEDILNTITMPRGSLKSTYVTKYVPLWLYLRYHNYRALIAGNTEPNARTKMKGLQAVIRSQKWAALFPDCLPATGAPFSTTAILLPRDGEFDEATFESAGTGTNLIGRHYTHIIEDDTTAPDDSDMTIGVTLPSREIIEKAIGFHQNTVPLLVPKGFRAQTIVSTRWGLNDLLDHIWRNEEGYRRFDAPAITGAGVSNWWQGRPMFSKFYPIARLRKIEQRMSANMFACLYLNKPQDPGIKRFKPEWWRDITIPHERIPRTGYVTIALDPAISENDDACESAITVVRHYLDAGTRKQDWLEDRAGHWDEVETIEQLCSTLLRYQDEGFSVTGVIIESIAFQSIYKRLYTNYLAEHNITHRAAPLRDFPAMRRNKHARIEGILLPLLKQRQVRFSSRLSGRVAEQLEDFSQNSLVDILDSLSMHSILAAHSEPNKPDQPESPRPHHRDVSVVLSKLFSRSGNYYRPARLSDRMPCPNLSRSH